MILLLEIGVKSFAHHVDLNESCTYQWKTKATIISVARIPLEII